MAACVPPRICIVGRRCLLFSPSPGGERRTPVPVAVPGAVPRVRMSTSAMAVGMLHVWAASRSVFSLTLPMSRRRFDRLPREQAGRPPSVRARSLRTQQRAKSQCQKPRPGRHGRLSRAVPPSRRKFLWYMTDNYLFASYVCGARSPVVARPRALFTMLAAALRARLSLRHLRRV